MQHVSCLQIIIFVRTVLTDLLDTSCQLLSLLSLLLSNCHNCDKQQFQTLSCVHYTNFSATKLDLFIRALLLDGILALEKTYAYASRTSCCFYFSEVCATTRKFVVLIKFGIFRISRVYYRK